MPGLKTGRRPRKRNTFRNVDFTKRGQEIADMFRDPNAVKSRGNDQTSKQVTEVEVGSDDDRQ